ncbi:unnamed protein product [Lactuca virosa]|uniref:Helitron helicase-like domain-containing protein n=1 Tax=Lactuca virosa TaxID=75947 RepID=A0AAU9LYP9_9ASTR|nr:unnamed protein product [Lactuca virosa]
MYWEPGATNSLHENPGSNLKLRLIGKREQDGRIYNLPTSSEVVALIVGDICDLIEKRDIIVETSSGLLKCISELHLSYLALQYPLLFPYGDDGYRVDILHRVVYTIEFQKRGLSHSHICLFMHSVCKLPTIEYIDPIIPAEIPNIDEDPELYSLVKEFMIHGPCGAENFNCPCMVDRKCSKNFPKQFCNHTSVYSDDFPLYRRRNDGNFVEKSGVQLDNRNVVPYNKYLLKRYQTHINVEWHPAVIRLPFHLPGQQQVVYEADDDIQDVLDRPSVASSVFISWMKCNEINKEARKLTYVEFPTKFVWKPKLQTRKPREVGFSIGRIHSVSPKLGEAYFLRILLNKVKGPRSFKEIRTVNGEVCSSFKDACYNLGLLDDDKEYIEAIKEASLFGSGFYLRFLFAMMLLSSSLCKPEIVWENTWEYLSDGILYTQQKRLKSPDIICLLHYY